MTKLKKSNYIYLTPTVIFTIIFSLVFTIPLDSVQATSPQLNVTKIVINDNGGTAVPSNFTMIVNGTNPSPSSFPGNASGTLVTLDAGSYNVTETGPNGYAATFSLGCSGTINVTQTKQCIVTNNDIATPPQNETLSANRDSFLRNGNPNRNEGINEILLINPNNRPVISFNQTEIENALGNMTLQNATLRLYVESNGNNWGSSGRTVDVHRIIVDWAEGNGWNLGNSIKGTGSGVTWNCAIDTNINNGNADCSPQWAGGNFTSTVTDSVLITNGLVNQFVEFDVTNDVEAFLNGTQNNGWIVKRTTSQNGQIEITSSEGSANNPELVLFFD